MLGIAAATFTTGEMIAFTVLVGLAVLLALAFLAYAVPRHSASTSDTLEALAQTGLFTLGAQILIALIFGYALVLLMETKVISSEAGLPALTGLTGFVVGKGATVSGPIRKPPENGHVATSTSDNH